MITKIIQSRVIVLVSLFVAFLGLTAQISLAHTPVSKTSVAPISTESDLFTREVKPLLQKYCVGCHGVDMRLSGLDFRSRATALHGGNRGAALIAGSAEKSLLYKLITGQRAPAMPPSHKLTDSEIQSFKRWIDSGASWGGQDVKSGSKQIWWSFKPPVKPKVPVFKGNAWVHNPIDAFVLSSLKSANISPSPPTSRRALIRRVYLDLIGLPPTPEQVHAFEQDRSSNSYAKVVDQLLDSPAYGERWGRHWLDLVRYADSGGFEGDKDRPLIWKYRDYVIGSFNRDQPYNEFLKQQIAGDEFEPDSGEALIATGYLACGPLDVVEANARSRSNELDDLVSTTGSVVLGLTIGCARCHDHKYDPIKQTDYYRMSAIFAPTERRESDIPGIAAQCKINQQNSSKHDSFDLAEQIETIQIRRESPALTVSDKSRSFPVSHVLVRGDAYHLGAEVQPGFICSLPGGTRIVSSSEATPATTGRRKALAEWLTSNENPLTSRVWINRVWRQHFGRGLVNTSSNFGISGELPSHPELLDWLATEFQNQGWRLKPLHRLMLLSSTYQQESNIRDAVQKIDPQNRLYWRMPVRRLEAEAIRDSILTVAGTLNAEMGGPPVYPPIDPSLRADTFQGPNWHDGNDDSSTWRRSVYVKVKRSTLLPELEVFDCPEITNSVAQRNITTTPLQALTLLNDPIIIHQARLFAERLQKECGNDRLKQIVLTYRHCLCRPPSAREISLSETYMRSRGANALQDFCHAIFNLNEFVYVP